MSNNAIINTGGGGGGIGGSTGATGNAILRSDGTGGATLQGSLVVIDDSGNVTVPNGSGFGSPSGTLKVNGFGEFQMGGVWQYPASTGQLRFYAASYGAFQILRFMGGGVLEIEQSASLGIADTNTARLGVKDVAGTAEMFVMDEAGNETQISPHNHTAPLSFIDTPYDEVGFSLNYYTGLAYYTNRRRQRSGREDALLIESFEQHNARLGTSLVMLDWATVQQAHVATSQASRAKWALDKASWEDDEENGGRPYPYPQPALYTAKPVPQWLTDQLANKTDLLAANAAIHAASSSNVTKRTGLKNAVATLRAWKADADSATGSWDGWTQTQKNAALKTVIQRFGSMVDKMADLIEAQGIGS